MNNTLRIGIIGGAGWLGGAIATSILGSGMILAENLSLSYRSQRPNRFPDAFWTQDNQALADRSDVIIVSVRPNDWPSIAAIGTGKLILSVMAGIRLEQLSAHHKTQRVARALPNAAAEVGRSYTPWTASRQVTADDRAIVRLVFDACGLQDEVQTERDIDYLTGLTGSGPAFPALLAQALMVDAVSYGLNADIARRAVNSLLVGAGQLLSLRDQNPAEIVETFIAYRGTTATAIDAMRAAGFDRAVANGLAAAFKKSVSMGDAS
eukprot:gene17300-17490_t